MNPFTNLGMPELMSLILLIVILNITGLWPRIIRGIAELRGDVPPESPKESAPPISKTNLEMCYRLLGISPTAPWDEIERAYRAKAKKHHPDLGGDEDAMRALNEAYSLLKQSRRPR